MQDDDIIGVFLGLQSSKLEYVAEIIAPYQSTFKPVIGGFMLIDSVNDYLVARVMDYVPHGELTSFMGIKWLNDVALTPEAIGQDIKTKKISYKVKIKLLGALNKADSKFKPGIQVIPHITSRVINPSTDMVRQICNQALKDQQNGPKVGTYWMDKEINIHFNLEDLISKRTFIFARAGYGKSNLMKVLASNWKNEYGGLVIFDPEGEYGVTDDDGRPGIMDSIPSVLVTNRGDYKDKPNVYNTMKFNLKEFSPNFIIPILVPEEKHTTIFFQKLMTLNYRSWAKLVDLLFNKGWAADKTEIAEIVEGKDENAKDLQPILNNLVNPIYKLHDPNSKLLEIIRKTIRNGDVIIIDISLIDSINALKFCSTIVGYFFNENQQVFTGASGRLNKAVFVMEEAQSVLGKSSSNSKFIELAKEGRKYKLGGIFITQQPGSIQSEILSQADNFFVFHLLSKGDLSALNSANAHYSSDIQTQILSEPTKGKAYTWTSNQPFVLPVMIQNFENITEPNKSKYIQQDHKLLSEALSDIMNDDDIYQSIYNKYLKLQPNINDRNKLTVALFNQLDEDEKEYCRDKQWIKKNSDTQEEFAVSWQLEKELRLLGKSNQVPTKKQDKLFL